MLAGGPIILGRAMRRFVLRKGIACIFPLGPSSLSVSRVARNFGGGCFEGEDQTKKGRHPKLVRF